MSLKNKLKNNELTLGSWITIGHPSVVDVMSSAGFEWLVIDMEHTSIDLTTAHSLPSAESRDPPSSAGDNPGYL